VGVGLLTNPGLIFLDEPTTGLDSSIAYSLMKTLVDLARNGRTVVCTIHQPRFEIFRLFDKLLLLTKGETFYFGPTSEAVKYFYSLGYRCPRYKNPADYFLDVMKREERSGGSKEITKKFRTHPLFLQTKKYLEAVGSTVKQHKDRNVNRYKFWKKKRSEVNNLIDDDSSMTDDDADESSSSDVEMKDMSSSSSISSSRRNESQIVVPNYIASTYDEEELAKRINDGPCLYNCKKFGREFLMFFIRFGVLWLRSMRNNYRNPMLLIAQLSQCTIIGLFLGITFLNTGDDQTGTYDKFGFLFFTLLSIIFNAMIAAVSVYPRERPVYNRERADGMYGTLPYFLASMLSTMPLQFLTGTVYSSIVYYMVGLRAPPDHFFIFVATTIMVCLLGESFGFMLSSIVPNFEMANLLAGLSYLLWLLTSGFLVSNQNLRSWWSWISYTSMIKYGLEVYSVNEFQGVTLECGGTASVCPLDPANQTITWDGFEVEVSSLNLTCTPACQYPTGDAFLASLKLNERTLAEDWAIMFGMLVAFRLLFFLSLKFLKIGKS
jgi:ABC-type multidrug transport system permease subunit